MRAIESEIIRRHPRRDESDSELKVVYGRRDIFVDKLYEGLCIISMWEVRERGSTDERAERSSIEIEKNWVENGALGHSEGKRG